MSNIKNNRIRGIDAKLSHRDYFDFTLYQNLDMNICGDSDDENCLIAAFDFNDPNVLHGVDRFVSTEKWGLGVFPDSPVPNYGLTGMDNGYLPYIKNTDCNEFNLFETMLISSELNFPFEDKFYLSRVNYNGVAGLVDDAEHGKVLTLDGGYYQGFYKLDGYNYQTLPNRYLNGFTMTIKLKRFERESYGNNDDFFLYLGTRAENKFWSPFEKDNVECDDPQFSNFTEKTFSLEFSDGVIGNLNDKITTKRVITNKFLIYGRSKNSSDGLGKYTGNVNEVIVDELEKPKVLNTNPFLIYGRGKGQTCGCTDSVLTHQITACGDISDFVVEETLPNPIDDVVDNSLGFRMTSEGAIQYRMIIKENDEVIIREESTPNGLIQFNEWTNLVIKWEPNSFYSEEECNPEKRLGRLMIYVNCYLKHVFEEFPEFIAKRLDTEKEKQVSVPYTISLGGGTIGLKENKTFNGPDTNDYGLPLELLFDGSFKGQIANFKIYDCSLNWVEIKKLCGK